MVDFARKLSDLLDGTRSRRTEGVVIVTTANGTTQVASGGGKLALLRLRELHSGASAGTPSEHTSVKSEAL
jgi:hypothetical protein